MFIGVIGLFVVVKIQVESTYTSDLESLLSLRNERGVDHSNDYYNNESSTIKI